MVSCQDNLVKLVKNVKPSLWWRRWGWQQSKLSYVHSIRTRLQSNRQYTGVGMLVQHTDTQFFYNIPTKNISLLCYKAGKPREREKLNNKSTVKAGAIKAHINAATCNNCHNTNGQNHCKTNHCCPLLITALLLPKPYRCHHACEDCASILEMSLAKTCCTASLFLES